MGKVTTYCAISGCNPEAPSGLRWIVGEPGYYAADPPAILAEASNILADELDEQNRVEELTVIGLVKENGFPMFEYEDQDFGRDVPLPELFTLGDSDENLRVIPHCCPGDEWDMGFVTAPSTPQGARTFIVSYAVNVMVLSSVLDILSLATNKRVTPRRLWRTIMIKRREDYNTHALETDVQYGKWFPNVLQQDPIVLPGWDSSEIDDESLKLRWNELEEKGNLLEAVKALTWEGGYWIWLSPDRFPLKSDAAIDSEPLLGSTVVTTRGDQPLSPATIPPELLRAIAILLPLPSLLSLAATCRGIRSSLLHSSSQTSLAKEWIYKTGPYYFPHEHEDEVQGSWWDYLKRCAGSGSMRNRKRIWCVVGSIEQLVDEVESRGFP